MSRLTCILFLSASTTVACSVVAGLDQFGGAQLAPSPGRDAAVDASSLEGPDASGDDGAGPPGSSVDVGGGGPPGQAPAASTGAPPGSLPDAAPEGASSQPLLSYTFDQSIERFQGDRSTPPSLASATTYVWDGTVGFTSPGSVKITSPFSGLGQILTSQVNLPASLNLAGKTMHLHARLESGLTSGAPYATIRIFAKSTGAYLYADNGSVTLVPNVWIDLSFPLDSPSGFVSPGFDATQIVSVGCEIDTPPTGTLLPNDGGGFFSTAVVHIDDLVSQ